MEVSGWNLAGSFTSEWLRLSAPPSRPARQLLPQGTGKVVWQLPTDGQLTEWTLPQAPGPRSCVLVGVDNRPRLPQRKGKNCAALSGREAGGLE